MASSAIALWDERRLALDFFLWTTLAMLPVFAAVTLHLDLLRDRDGYRLSAVNLPTALTLLRFCLAPGIALFLAEHHYALALGIYLAAELSDVADGWLARRLRQITRLGTVLDPMVDILFNIIVFVGLFLGGVIPSWVLGVALLRYAIFLFGGAYLYLFVGPVTIRPTLFGRLSGVVMVGLTAFLLLLHVLRAHWLERLAPLTTLALGVLLVAAVGQVVALGWYNLAHSLRKLTRNGEAVTLTAREFALVEFVALHRGQVVTRTMLYEHLFDETDDTLSNLLDVHVSNIRKKLGHDFITTRRGHGYCIESAQ